MTRGERDDLCLWDATSRHPNGSVGEGRYRSPDGGITAGRGALPLGRLMLIRWTRFVMARVYASNAGFYSTINRVYARHFPTNPPSRTFVPVASWPMEFDIEIEVVQRRPKGLVAGSQQVGEALRKRRTHGMSLRRAYPWCILLRSAGARHRAHAPRIMFRRKGSPRRPRLPMLPDCLQYNTTALSDRVTSARSGDARPNEQRPIGLMSRSCFVPSRTTFRSCWPRSKSRPTSRNGGVHTYRPGARAGSSVRTVQS